MAPTEGRKVRTGRDRIVFWAVLTLGVVAGATPLFPTRPPVDPAPTEFSARQAFEHIERLAMAPRPIGSEANERTREWVADELRDLGLDPELQTLEAPDYFGAPGATVEVVNLMARIPGTSSSGAVALMGHLDTVPRSPGANDDAAAVASILESARALLAGPAIRNDVILLFTDGEEPAPHFGSTAFVADHPWFDDVAVVVNLEAVGGSGPSLLVEASGPGRWAVDQYSEAVPYPAAFSFATALNDLTGGSNTDLAAFRDAGVPGLDSAYLHNSPIYHTAHDVPDAVSLASLHAQGSNALGLARHLGDLDLRDQSSGSTAGFFTIAGLGVVAYPLAATAPIVMVAGVALAVAVWRRRAWRRVLRSLGTTSITVLASAMLAVTAWVVLAGRRDTMGPIESYVYLACLVGLTAGAGSVSARLVARRTGDRPEPIGAAALCWVLALLTGLLAPGIAYLFAAPALVAALAFAARTLRAEDTRWAGVRLAVVAWPTLLLLVPAIDTFFQLAQPRPGNLDSQILPVIAIPVLLASLVIELVRPYPAAYRDGRPRERRPARPQS